MKALTLLLSALLPASSLLGAAKQVEEVPRNDFIVARGEWNKPRNWSLGHVPKDESAKIIKGSLVKLDTAVPLIDSFSVGSRAQPSTLILEDGANLKVRSVAAVWCNADDGQARFHLKGGQIETGEGDNDGAILVGTGNTYSGTAIATLSGGKVIGSILIGSSLLGTHKGKVVVEGSAPVIVAGPLPRAHFLVATHGVVEFIFDEKGVGFFDYAASPFKNRLMAGSTIVVDGAKYQGNAVRTFALFTAGRMDDEGADIQIKGFSSAYKTEILKLYRRVPGLYIKVSPVK